MSAITVTPAANLDSFVVPVLTRFAARPARPVQQQAEVRRTSGLSVADISDASLRATVRGGLTVRRPAYPR